MLEGCQFVIEAQKMGIILYWHTCELLGSTRVCVVIRAEFRAGPIRSWRNALRQLHYNNISTFLSGK